MRFNSIAQAAAVLLFTGSTTALFECNADQNAFPAEAGKFVVHYTSIRDENLNGSPWIRICKPSDDGKFINVPEIGTPCDLETVTVSADKAQLNHELRVTNGDGCDKDESGLDGAEIVYNGQVRDLSGDDPNCGKRSKGISCQFDL